MRDHLKQNVSSLLYREVQRHALFIACVNLPPKLFFLNRPAAQWIALARRLDLDDLGTEITQQGSDTATRHESG